MIKRTKVLSCSLDPHIRSVSLCNQLLELRVRQIEANLCQLGWGWRFLCFVHWSNAPDQIDWVKITGACGLSENCCNELLELRVWQLVANLCQLRLGWGWRFLCFVHSSNAPDEITSVKMTDGYGLSENRCNTLLELHVSRKSVDENLLFLSIR